MRPRRLPGVADMPVKIATQRIGVGLMVNQESQGLYSTLNIDAQLGYKFKKLGGEWTVGLGIGMYDQSFKGSEVYLPDDDDFHQGSDEGIPTSDIHGTGLDVAAASITNIVCSGRAELHTSQQSYSNDDRGRNRWFSRRGAEFQFHGTPYSLFHGRMQYSAKTRYLK